MRLGDGYADLPAGKLANVVTCLEMRQLPAMRPDPPQARELRRMRDIDLGWYRELFRRVGTSYLWSSRLVMSDAELAGIVHDDRVEVYALRSGDKDAALLELDFRQAGECELVFFGVVDEQIGTGAGRWLMNRAIERAWSQPISRFWVHTCTFDHPSALPFYIRSGFVPYKRQVEVYDDPRVLGLLPREAAPGIPIL